MTRPISVFVVDDHALFREGLLRLLSTDPQLEVVGGASSLDEALTGLPSAGVDVLIVDYDLGDASAVALVRQLRERQYAARILLVTAGLPDRDALELVRLGISGIVHKQHSPEALQRSILDVASGAVHIEQRYLQSLIQSAADAPARPRLTAREREVIRLLLEGLSNKEIGSELGVSEGAVKASLQQLFAKTGVRTRSQLVRIALEQHDVL
ncbi:response regulator transcription factor [Luteitalea sp.]|uniref:response regulator n=1 Tax=Luteitalea sp. TaxID=2004800 RepID=UPI0025C662A8|nr:response regulator transcription factor [Luteitalea sp.]